LTATRASPAGDVFQKFGDCADRPRAPGQLSQTLDGNSSNRANIVGNPHLDPNRSRNDVMNMWFNTAAFVSPVTGQDGNAAGNLLDSPGSKNADIA